MIINIGTKNPVKVQALKEVLKNYDFLRDAKIFPIEASSNVSDQPKTMKETIRGAMNRAKNAFKNCSLSIGIEGGMSEIPFTKTDYMNIEVCAIFDGREFHIGLSPGFEYPREVTRLVLEEGMTISEAFHKAGLTDNPRIGTAEGAIGFLTKGRLSRKDYTKPSIVMALIHLENSKLFEVRS